MTKQVTITNEQSAAVLHSLCAGSALIKSRIEECERHSSDASMYHRWLAENQEAIKAITAATFGVTYPDVFAEEFAKVFSHE